MLFVASRAAAEPLVEPLVEPNAIEQLNLEAHGSVSFGYLPTWGNDWTGEGHGGSSENGTTDFWEAMANVDEEAGFFRLVGQSQQSRLHRRCDHLRVSVGNLALPV